MIQLGDKVKDMVTGISGIAVAKTEWINGCVRYTIEFRGGTKESPEVKRETFDVETLVVSKHGAVTPAIRQRERIPSGGGRPDPVRRG